MTRCSFTTKPLRSIFSLFRKGVSLALVVVLKLQAGARLASALTVSVGSKEPTAGLTEQAHHAFNPRRISAKGFFASNSKTTFIVPAPHPRQGGRMQPKRNPRSRGTGTTCWATVRTLCSRTRAAVPSRLGSLPLPILSTLNKRDETFTSMSSEAERNIPK